MPPMARLRLQTISRTEELRRPARISHKSLRLLLEIFGQRRNDLLKPMMIIQGLNGMPTGMSCLACRITILTWGMATPPIPAPNHDGIEYKSARDGCALLGPSTAIVDLDTSAVCQSGDNTGQSHPGQECSTGADPGVLTEISNSDKHAGRAWRMSLHYRREDGNPDIGRYLHALCIRACVCGWDDGRSGRWYLRGLSNGACLPSKMVASATTSASPARPRLAG
jgi:hypothetical protein